MRERPILFNTEMVKALLYGRKTCTRRVCKDVNAYMVPDMEFYNADKRTYALHNYADREHTEPLSLVERKCPIYPGDILYVRETWREWTDGYLYKAWTEPFPQPGQFPEIKWKPSIHMPKEAARIWLKVTNVRVERLQEITEEGAKAEGMPDDLDYPVDKAYCPVCNGIGLLDSHDINTLGHVEIDCESCNTYVKRFKNLWNTTINGKDIDTYGWDANPYVWVIEFERCEKPGKD